MMRLLSSILCVAVLAGCSSSDKPTPELSVQPVSIFAEPGANNNSAVAVDVVLVYDKTLEGSIAAMPASKYFAQSEQLLRDNPTLLDVWHWELVPGQLVKDFALEQDKGEAFGGFVFANYSTPGDHRIKVGPDGMVQVVLMNKNMGNLAASNYRDVRQGSTMSHAAPPKQTPKKTTQSRPGITMHGHVVTSGGHPFGETSPSGYDEENSNAKSRNIDMPQRSTGCSKI